MDGRIQLSSFGAPRAHIFPSGRVADESQSNRIESSVNRCRHPSADPPPRAKGFPPKGRFSEKTNPRAGGKFRGEKAQGALRGERCSSSNVPSPFAAAPPASSFNIYFGRMPLFRLCLCLCPLRLTTIYRPDSLLLSSSRRRAYDAPVQSQSLGPDALYIEC
uniref:Uncharacterized protein n=1 Tax=Odontella aurita TaxID=265563 RepID=A0A7S4JR91_9STRA